MEQNGAGAKRIFMIEDDPAVRLGLKLLLEQERYVVCGEAAGNAETLEKIGPSRPDLALLDISLGDEDGLELVPELHRRGIAVLVYSMHEDALTIDRAFGAAAEGFVSKRDEPEALLAALADVLAGKRHVSPRVARQMKRQ